MTTEFAAGFGGCKGPSNLDSSLVTLGLPSQRLVRKYLLGRDAAVKALAHKDGKFNFGHVEPTAMLGGEVKVELVLELMGALCWEMFIK